MARFVCYLGLGLFTIAIAGCGGEAEKPAANAGGGGAAAAPPAPMPGAPMPGMAGAPGAMNAPGAMPAGMAGGMGPGAMTAPGMTTAATNPDGSPATGNAAPIRDPLIYLPANLTFAIGGRPAASLQAKSKITASLLAQFSPLTDVLSKIGLPAQQFESFWAGGTADMSEHAICVVTSTDLNIQLMRQALLATTAPPESKVWPLPGPAGATHALAIADSRTVIVGRRTTVDAALRKTPSMIVKQGLASINSPDADFWIAGDAAAAKSFLAGGFPLVGTYTQPIEQLTGFGVAMTLEGRTPVAGTGMGNPGMMGGMAPGAPYPGQTSASPGVSPSAYPMPMGPMANPMPMGPMATPMPMGPMAVAPMAGTPTATDPKAIGGPPAATVAGGDNLGVLVVVALTFDAEPSATTVRMPLERFLSTNSRRFGPKMARYIPDLNGVGAAGGQPGMAGAPGMGAGALGMTSADILKGPMGPMGPMGPPGSPGSGDANGGRPVPNIPVILENPKPNGPIGAPPPPDLRLAPVTPPQPTVATTAVAGTPSDPNSPMPAGAYPTGATSADPMPAYVPPPGSIAPTAGNYAPPGMAGAYGAGAGGPGGPGAQWVHQKGALLHFGYRFDARDETLAVAGYVLQGLGATPQGSVLTTGLLSDLHRAHQEWRLKGAEDGRKNRGGFGPQGFSWMTQLLPFMGHAPLYQKFDFNKPVSDKANLNLTHAVIPGFLNPADARQQWHGAPYSQMGLTHFVGMSGAEDESGPPAATLPRNDPRAGIFGYNDVATPEMITDGQSQTIMMIGSGRMASPWAVGGGATIRGARPGSFNPQTGFGSVGGPKPGAFVLFADGSVRFVSADIDSKVFQSLSTTHGAESVDLPALQGSGSVLDKW